MIILMVDSALQHNTPSVHFVLNIFKRFLSIAWIAEDLYHDEKIKQIIINKIIKRYVLKKM